MKDICRQTLGETWLSVLQEVYRAGVTVGDDTRESLNISASFGQADFEADPLLVRFASRENVEQMWKVFFSDQPNAFGHSYRDHIRGPRGRCDLSDVIELLQSEPLSKRAAIGLVGAGDGRVPCINVVHFLRREPGLVATYFARGQDIFRKFYADALCIHEMARRVANAIATPISRVTGIISSAHIYLADLAAVDSLLTEAGALPAAGGSGASK